MTAAAIIGFIVYKSIEDSTFFFSTIAFSGKKSKERMGIIMKSSDRDQIEPTFFNQNRKKLFVEK